MPEQFLHGAEVVQIDDGIRPIRTAKSSVIGLVGTAPDADPAVFPENVPVLVEGPRKAAIAGAGGTLKDAYEAIYAQGASVAIFVNVPVGADDAATLANIVGDATLGTGVWALEHSASKLDLVPRILAAPGFTSTGAADPASPVVTNLIAVAEKLRATVISDGPNTNETDAKTEREKWGSDRLFIVDPAVTVFDSDAADYVTRPASGYAAGLIAKRDIEKGFWWSPSNQVINGISGTARPVSFNLSSTETEANRMNEAEVATIIRRNGFRLWGNRSASADAQWAFLSVRRTADIIYESIEAAHLWAMDRPMSAQLFQDIRDSVQGFGDNLVNQGALLGFKCWLDPELNTEATLKAGKLYLDFDFEPPAPLEHLVFRAHREGKYYDELISSVKAAA
ncbi:phage tail sheath subtilisin-like domain-containing protein [Aliiroseovarius lamellibrachiae]|uniref:phage tail sheath subtilisin-like domain-containing protein n=1 Tax=Aliiroseovarius lamellibrachiae TaxID=1924933 RepID=UPI001BE0FA84|nr:phage tail sheath subtilisin-like domain-containing protein [Aliiroseovarius lamellibrachiae]MBT2131231.1 phage tail sheath subtilisin-like domain-containing protein [Aliiroseovarius lamellibrachiae]